MDHRIVTVVTFVAVIVALIGCARNGALPQPVSTMESQGMPETSVRGRVMSESDVATLPDRPLRGVLVLAIPSDVFDSLLEEVGLTREANNRLNRLGLSLSKESFEKYVEDSAVSQQDGEYALKVPPGGYWLCLANLGSSQEPEMLPAYVNGCIEVAIPEGKDFTQDISWGLAGVTSQ